MAILSLLLFFAATAASTAQPPPQDDYYKEIYPAVDLDQADLSKHIFFALVQSFGAKFNGSGNIAGIKVALDRINSDSSILPNHTLHYTLSDSQVRENSSAWTTQ
jgi:hypothetical protein